MVYRLNAGYSLKDLSYDVFVPTMTLWQLNPFLAVPDEPVDANCTHIVFSGHLYCTSQNDTMRSIGEQFGSSRGQLERMNGLWGADIDASIGPLLTRLHSQLWTPQPNGGYMHSVVSLVDNGGVMAVVLNGLGECNTPPLCVVPRAGP